jgi:uncharacterized protein YjiK
MAWNPATGEPDFVLSAYRFARGSGAGAALPATLGEVSGLAVGPEGRLFAHNDEGGTIYEVDPERGIVLKGFSAGAGGIPGDFEGIAWAEGRFFLATSAGDLLEMAEGAAGAAMPFRVRATGLGRSCELEGLAFDPAERALLLPCKEPAAADLKGHLVVFSVPLETGRPDLVPRVFLPLAELVGVGLKAEFHPSAVEVHPRTGAILLLAAREEALLELTAQGRPVAAARLAKKDHPQPEGLALLPDGTLLIADEGQQGLGRITRYRPRPGEDGAAKGGRP